MTDKNETVTLSIETYEEMKEELKLLRQQVKKQTIIKEILPPVYGYVAGLIIIIVCIFFSTLGK